MRFANSVFYSAWNRLGEGGHRPECIVPELFRVFEQFRKTRYEFRASSFIVTVAVSTGQPL
jgi:hypothetical protein